MKKKLLLLILLLGFVALPFRVSAKEYNTMDLKETLADDEIEASFKEYKPNSDAINIYMFRGKGCGFCHAFLEFLNGITDEYGKYFKLVSYEVWYDTDNSTLMNDVSTYLGEEASGVPYIIIGDKTFKGYSETYDEAIKRAITDLYKTKKSKRYDVFSEMKKHPNKNNNGTTELTSNTNMIFTFIFVTVATIIIITFINLKFKELYLKMDLLDNKKTLKKEKR